MKKAGLSFLMLAAMTAQSYAADLCDAGAAAALKTAALQQELMVAGLTCHGDAQYNRFVTGFKPELQKSDAALMAYFKKRDGNEAGYDSYKTKLANLAANQQSRDTARYCANVRRDFAAADGMSLDDFVAGAHLLIAAPEACAVKFDRTEVAVAGVPSYELPARPYGAAPPAIAQTNYRPAYNEPPPPPARRNYDEQEWNDGQAYGPPPGWARRARRDSGYGRGVYRGYGYY